VIKNFISREKCKSLAEKFDKFCSDNNILPDDQVLNSPAYKNFIPFVEILCTKTKKVSKIVGEPLLPSYTYSRIYTNNSFLEKHVDRESCEISLTVHLDGDSNWPIYFENGDNKEYIDLQVGDAIIYYGVELSHGRDQYLGKKYIQCFLHYVRMNGPYANNFFDSENTFNNVSITQGIEKYIHVFDNAIPDDLCDKIIKEYSDDEYDTSHIFGDDMTYRTSKEVAISLPESIEKNPNKRKIIDDSIFKNMTTCLNQYLINFGIKMETLNDSGYHLLKYNVGEYYKEHIDSNSENAIRMISCSMILNDNYKGGDLLFFNGNYKPNLKKGSIVFFPSNFMFPHQVSPVTKGVRYSIVTWIA
jgi:hypothetical protein